jgi:hypothetical protein
MEGQLPEEKKKKVEDLLKGLMNKLAYSLEDERMTYEQVAALTCEINRSVAGIERCCDKETIGVLQLGGYSDPGFALGDAGNKYSYGCNVIYQEVRGLSFRLCQMGYDDPAIGNLKKAFNLIDNNGNGKLNREEIRAFLHRTQQKDEATDEQLDQLIKDNDHSGDGKLNFEEFCKAAGDIMPPIEDAFKEAVQALEAKGVVAITADCGFFVQFNKVARSHATIPVMLSSVCQIPQVELIIDKKDKFAIFTANAGTFDKPEMAEIMK